MASTSLVTALSRWKDERGKIRRERPVPKPCRGLTEGGPRKTVEIPAPMGGQVFGEENKTPSESRRLQKIQPFGLEGGASVLMHGRLPRRPPPSARESMRRERKRGRSGNKILIRGRV